MINIKQLGAKADNNTDICPYLELAKKYSGGIIYLPSGIYKMNSTVELGWGQSITGNIEAASTIFYDGQTCFTTTGRNNISNLTFRCTYNDPLNATEILAAEPIIDGINSYGKIENINIGNAYIGIKQSLQAPVYIEHIRGVPLKYGIYIHNGLDIVHIQDIHFNPNYYGTPNVIYSEYCFENSYAIRIGRQDWASIVDCFIFGGKGLAHLTTGDTLTGSANNIIFKNVYIDACASLANFEHFDGNIEFNGGTGTFFNPFYSRAEEAGLTPKHADTYPLNLGTIPVADADNASTKWIKIENMYFYQADFNFALIQGGAQVVLRNNYFKNFHTLTSTTDVPPIIYAAGMSIIDGNYIKARDISITGEKQGILNASAQNIIVNNRIWGFNQPLATPIASEYIYNNNIEKDMY